MTTIERKRGRERVCVCVYVFDFVRLFFTLQTLFSLRRPPPPPFPRLFALNWGVVCFSFAQDLGRVGGGIGVLSDTGCGVSGYQTKKVSLSLSFSRLSRSLSLLRGGRVLCVERAGRAGRGSGAVVCLWRVRRRIGVRKAWEEGGKRQKEGGTRGGGGICC
jgi:hypothetical protein